MKKEKKPYKENAHLYYEIKDIKGSTDVNYVKYHKSQHSFARCILCSSIILFGLTFCGFGLAIWWKGIKFFSKESKKIYFACYEYYE